MKIIMLLLMYLVIVSAAISRDATKEPLDHVAFCSQFVIEHRDPSIVLNYTPNLHVFHAFHAFTWNGRNCLLYAPIDEERSW
jgi:hypothetical protein